MCWFVRHQAKLAGERERGVAVESHDHSGENIMADDKSKTGKSDRDRINTSEDYEVRYWSKKFSCTATELVAAVKAVGPMATDVQAYLNGKQ
jgi:hypothetical protein